MELFLDFLWINAVHFLHILKERLDLLCEKTRIETVKSLNLGHIKVSKMYQTLHIQVRLSKV